MENFYKLFEVPPTADIDVIRKAFRKKAKLCHPDLFQQLPADEYYKRQMEFVQLTKAYEILSDPQKRKFFDRQLAKNLKNRSTSHKQKNKRSSSFYSNKRNFNAKKEFSSNTKKSSAPKQEDSIDDLLKEVEELLEKFGLSVRDPLEILVEWAKIIFKEINGATDPLDDSINSSGRQNKNTQQSTSSEESLENLERELERLKVKIKTNSKENPEMNSKDNNDEIEDELRRIKKKYRL